MKKELDIENSFIKLLQEDLKYTYTNKYKKQPSSLRCYYPNQWNTNRTNRIKIIANITKKSNGANRKI